MLFWNIILTMVVVPFGWAFNKMFQEVKRIQILLNKTREEYARKDDVKDDMHELMDAIRRLEDKLDKILMGTKGFKPQGLQKIANRMGYTGSMQNFDNYLKQNLDKEREMIVYRQRAQEMAKGGSVIKLQTGGETTNTNQTTTATPTDIEQFSTQQALAPTLPVGGATVAKRYTCNSRTNCCSYKWTSNQEVKAPTPTQATVTQATAPTLTTANPKQKHLK